MALGVPQRRPADAVQQSDGMWKRPQTRYKPDGKPYETTALCCEDCWEPMPKYVGATHGWVSPESATKLRTATVEGKAGIEAVPKLVCYGCLRAAFERTSVAGSEFPTGLSGEVEEE